MQTKGSITPSVCLKIDIPDTIENSFYKGKVTVTYKDSVFQPSTPFRHGIEIQRILENGDGDVPPVLIIYSDGGPDHRITYHSVKLALIVLFKILDLDLLIVGRTAPGHSWLNPSERIMSVLNLAFQNVALMRDECTVEMEMTLKGANPMAEIRGKADRVRGLKQAWIQAVQPIIETLESRTNRLSLKGEQFTCKDAATDEDVTAFEQQLQQVVDGTITSSVYMGIPGQPFLPHFTPFLPPWTTFQNLLNIFKRYIIQNPHIIYLTYISKSFQLKSISFKA